MTEKSRFVIITTVFIVFTLVLAAVIGIYSLTSPGVLPVDAPPSEFSAERAMKHVSAIAQEPHPVGSLANEQVANYIVAQLEAMGLSPEVRPAATVSTFREIRAASMRNIIVKIPGTNPSKAIALDAHYDSMPMTLGASDAGSAVATALETARALKDSPPLQNDVILVFTDSEEFGPGLGAAAFLEEHPLAQEIGLVLNFEAIGKTGPSLMFETGPDCGWLVREFGSVTSHPVAQAWINDIYKLTP